MKYLKEKTISFIVQYWILYGKHSYSEYIIPLSYPPCDCIPWYITSFQSSPVNIWKTVNSAIANVLKLAGGVPSSKLNEPPNSCIPSRANIRINRNRRNNNDMIDLIEFNNDITKLRSDDQYEVTLKIRSRRSARSTDNPNESSFSADQITSNIEPNITTQSKRLNADSK